MEKSKILGGEHTSIRGTPPKIEVEETPSTFAAGRSTTSPSSSSPAVGELDEVQKTTEQTREESQKYAHAAKDTVASVKERGRSMLQDRKNALADNVSSFERALRRTAKELEGEDQRTAGHYAEQAANGLEQVSHALREQDFEALIGKTEDFARRQPGVFLGGAVAAGFLLARFLKSSGRRVGPAEASSVGTRGAADYRPGNAQNPYSAATNEDPDVRHGSISGSSAGVASDDIFVPTGRDQERGV